MQQDFKIEMGDPGLFMMYTVLFHIITAWSLSSTTSTNSQGWMLPLSNTIHNDLGGDGGQPHHPVHSAER